MRIQLFPSFEHLWIVELSFRFESSEDFCPNYVEEYLPSAHKTTFPGTAWTFQRKQHFIRIQNWLITEFYNGFAEKLAMMTTF